MLTEQERFDLTVGKLDRSLSEIVSYAKDAKAGSLLMDTANRQTLKHHADDMMLAAKKIYKDLGLEDKT